MKNYYKILGIKENATEAEIKKAYKKLAKQHHPDLNQNNKESEAKFKEVSEAYEALMNPQKNTTQADYSNMQGAKFDNTMSDIFKDMYKQRGRSSNPDMEETLNDVFGNFFSRGAGSSRPQGNKSQAQKNYEVNYPLEFILWATGGNVSLNLKNINIEAPVSITLTPAMNLEEMYAVALKDQGIMLHVRFILQPHPYFSLNEKKELVLTYPITLKDFMEKEKIQVPTLTGKVEMNLPKENFNSEKRLALKTKGIKGEAMFVKFKILFPAKNNPLNNQAEEVTQFNNFFKIG